MEWKRLKDGSFFLTSSQIKDAELLRRLLFAWHEPSYYGALIDVAEHGDKDGLRLSPYVAMTYFKQPKGVKHLRVNRDKSLELLGDIASIYSEALAMDWIIPDYHRCIEGQAAWRLDLPEHEQQKWEELISLAQQIPIDTDSWLNQIMREVAMLDSRYTNWWSILEQSVEMMASLQGSTNAQTVLSPQGFAQVIDNGNESASGIPVMDEDEWLVRIGWKHDVTPFKVGLQLNEPGEGSAVWTLSVIFQDQQSPERMVELRRADWIETDRMNERLPEAWQTLAKDKLMSEAQRWLAVIPELKAEETNGLFKDHLSEAEAWNFLSEWSMQLSKYGCLVSLPKWWEASKMKKPKLKGLARRGPQGSGTGPGVPEASTSSSRVGLNQMFEFDWSIAVGDVELTEQEFMRILHSGQRFIRSGDEWIQLHPEVLKQIQKSLNRIHKNGGLSLQDVLHQHLLDWESHNSTGESPAHILESSQHPGIADSQPFPSDQLFDRIELELPVVVERLLMQLKDTSALSLEHAPSGFQGELRPYQLEGMSWLLYLRQFGLGACLADDMGLGKTIQWISYLLTAERKGPSLLICPTSVLGNWQKEFERFAPNLNVYLHYGQQRCKGSAFTESIQMADVVLTSYPLSHLDAEELSGTAWDSICLDEAQQIKNSYTKQSQAIRLLRAHHKVAMTGTPVENRLRELWSIFDFINPGYLGSEQQFQKQFVQPIEREQQAERVKALQQLVRPFLLRREKKDPAIRLNLPDKSESKCYVTLTAWQGTLYEQVLEHLFTRVDRLSMMERRGLILSSITKLKQICNHPYLFLKDQAHEGVEEIVRDSNKMIRLVDMIQSLRDNDERCLIFTQYIGMGHLMQQVLQATLGEDVKFMHGSVPKASRDEIVANFQDPGSNEGVLILSLKTGGTGLNLTAANHVFHVDRWWNPAVENQATDRVYRLGQSKDVQVYKFVTLGTLEEKIDEMLELKQGLSEQIIGSGENWLTELSSGDLRDVLSLRRQWIDPA